MNNLLEKIKNKTAKVGIIGLGYVGLPLLLRFAEKEFEVIGFDIDPEKIDKLSKGKSYIVHINESKIKQAFAAKASCTTDFSKISYVDAIIMCVPTPLGKHLDPDLTYVVNTIESIIPYIRKGQVISLESTTYPGTTDEEIVPRVTAKDLTIGKDFHVIYSPEREDPGNKNFTTHNTPRICGGVTDECLKVGVALYGSIIDKIVPVSSTKIAEMAKILENVHRAVNIGLVNELKILADKMGIDIHEVINAAATKPFGFTPYYPGPGLGGHCIPIDPFYLTWKAKEFGIHTRFIELAGEINNSMPMYVVRKTAEGLNNHKKAVNGSKILVLGLAYKKNVDDPRESPSIEILELLNERGAILSYSDPYIPNFPKMRKHKFNLSSVALTEKLIKEQDCIVIATDHDDFDYSMIAKHAKLIIDSRGVYKKPAKNIVKA